MVIHEEGGVGGGGSEGRRGVGEGEGGKVGAACVRGGERREEQPV